MTEQEDHADEIERLSGLVKTLEVENYKMAAGMCHGGYGDEGGSWRCKYQNRIEYLHKARSEQLTAFHEYFYGSAKTVGKLAAAEAVVEAAKEVLPWFISRNAAPNQIKPNNPMLNLIEVIEAYDKAMKARDQPLEDT